MQSPPTKITGTLIRDGGTWVAVLPRLELMARSADDGQAIELLLYRIRQRTSLTKADLWVQRMPLDSRFSIWGPVEILTDWVREAASQAAQGYRQSTKGSKHG